MLFCDNSEDWQYLDIDSKVKFAFITENNFYTFALPEAGRSVAFNIPATSHNNQILEFAKNPAEDGDCMRYIFNNSQLQYPNGAINGTLYICEATPNSYKCIFLYGNDINLKRLRELGVLGNFVEPFDNYKVWIDNTPKDANSQQVLPLGNFGEFEIVKYCDNEMFERWHRVPHPRPPMPSIELYTLLIRALGDAEIEHNLTKKDEDYAVRLVVSPKIATFGTAHITQEQNTRVNFASTGVGALNISVQTIGHEDIGYIDVFKVRRTQADQNVDFVFGIDTPEDVFLGRVVGMDSSEILIVPYGGYKPTADSTEGTPLAGRTVTLDEIVDYQSAMYRFYRRADFLRQQNDLVVISAASNRDAIFNVTCTCKQTPIFAEIYEYPAIFDIDLMELIYTYANIWGLVVSWEDGRLIFRSEFYDINNPININNDLIEISSIKRAFMDFGQNNKVLLSGSDGQYGCQNYTLSNRQLERTKILFESNFTVGDPNPYKPWLGYINDAERSASGWSPTEFDPAIFECRNSSEYMYIVDIRKNMMLARLVTASTQIKVKFTLPAADYFAIKKTTTFYVQGQLYIWTSLNWSEGICEAVLQII